MRSENLTNDRSPERTFIETVRRAQIVNHTIEVLAEVGYGKASLALIAQRAGISKGVISYHFNGKAELIDQVEQEVTRAMEAAVSPRVNVEDTASGMLRTFIEANLEYMRDHRSHLLAIIEIFFMRTRSQDRRPDYEAFEYEPVFEALERIFEFGQQNGEFREFNTRVMAVAVWAAVEGVFTQWAAYPDLQLDAHTTELVDLFDRATRLE
jgi:TetR/AcrR family transcriptional regulator, fatty acid metabolism regulator protein